jgi:hypothetical protein
MRIIGFGQPVKELPFRDRDPPVSSQVDCGTALATQGHLLSSATQIKQDVGRQLLRRYLLGFAEQPNHHD